MLRVCFRDDSMYGFLPAFISTLPPKRNCSTDAKNLTVDLAAWCVSSSRVTIYIMKLKVKKGGLLV